MNLIVVPEFCIAAKCRIGKDANNEINERYENGSRIPTYSYKSYDRDTKTALELDPEMTD